MQQFSRSAPPKKSNKPKILFLDARLNLPQIHNNYAVDNIILFLREKERQNGLAAGSAKKMKVHGVPRARATYRKLLVRDSEAASDARSYSGRDAACDTLPVNRSVYDARSNLERGGPVRAVPTFLTGPISQFSRAPTSRQPSSMNTATYYCTPLLHISFEPNNTAKTTSAPFLFYQSNVLLKKQKYRARVTLFNQNQITNLYQKVRYNNKGSILVKTFC